MYLAHLDNEYEASGKKEVDTWAKQMENPEKYAAWVKKYTTSATSSDKSGKKAIKLKN